MATTITQRIENTRRLTVSEDVGLLSCTGITAFVVQGDTEFSYSIDTAVSDTEVDVQIPYDDAMSLNRGTVKIQLAWTDANGTPKCTKPKTMPVDEFIYSDGYEATTS